MLVGLLLGSLVKVTPVTTDVSVLGLGPGLVVTLRGGQEVPKKYPSFTLIQLILRIATSTYIRFDRDCDGSWNAQPYDGGYDGLDG